MNVKQVIVIRKDLRMPRGKECAQAAHAAMGWLIERIFAGKMPARNFADSDLYALQLSEAEELWLKGIFRKVVCQVNSEQALLDLSEAASKAKLTHYLIKDLGLTVFRGVPTWTALAIGPDADEKIDPITSHLNLY